MKKSIIIFRFYKEPFVCLNRLNLIKFYNPKIPIYGIYGGNNEDLPEHQKLLGNYFCNLYVIKNNSSEWKWKNFDLVLLDWYRDVGKQVDFNMAFTIEWDLLMFGSIKNIYTKINSGEVGLTALIPLAEIENNWFWTSVQPHKDEWNKLLSFVIETYQYSSKPFASLGPGVCFPKSFLEAYSELYLPEWCNDEIRFPLVAQLLGYPVKNTDFCKKWFCEEENIYFNCEGQPIDFQIIFNELASNRRKVFHPFFKIFDLSIIPKSK